MANQTQVHGNPAFQEPKSFIGEGETLECESPEPEQNPEGRDLGASPTWGGPASAEGPVLSMPDVSNTPAFNLTPVAAGEIFQCLLRREKSFMGPPTYYMYTPDGAQFLMAARRRKGVATANYLISTTKNEIKKESATIIGKVRARDGMPYKPHEYMVYTNGENPGKCEDEKQVREELAFVQFTQAKNFKDVTNAPQMRVCVPSTQPNGQSYKIKPMTDEHDDRSSMVNLIDKAASAKELTMLWTAPEVSFPLEFHGGRKSEPSVKTVALASEAGPCLKFGKVGKEDFLVEFLHPLSPCQAFGICLTLMDNNGCTENY